MIPPGMTLLCVKRFKTYIKEWKKTLKYKFNQYNLNVWILIV